MAFPTLCSTDRCPSTRSWIWGRSRRSYILKLEVVVQAEAPVARPSTATLEGGRAGVTDHFGTFGCRGDRSRCQIGGVINLPAGTSKPLLIIADAAAREARN